MTYTPLDANVLLSFLGDDANGLLKSYFSSDGAYTGGRFERLAGGGDREDVASTFTAEDIVAVSLLSVRIPGRAAIALLETQASDLSRDLSEIPVDVDLWEADDDVIGPQSPADRLWRKLQAIPGIEWVTAGKLLARKRPRLIPVYDRVVKAALGRHDGDEFWLPLRDALRDDDRLVPRLQELRDECEIGTDISLLRILDVAIWMRGDGQPVTE